MCDTQLGFDTYFAGQDVSWLILYVCFETPSLGISSRGGLAILFRCGSGLRLTLWVHCGQQEYAS